MRLFIAVCFDEISEYLKGLQKRLTGAKMTFPKEFHITLKFLGEVHEQRLGEIIKRLGDARFRAYTAKLGCIGVFPDEESARVVWLGVEDSGNTLLLKQEIDRALHGMFAEEKEKGFMPHITIARIKLIESSRRKEFAENAKKTAVDERSVCVRSFRLIKSTLTPEGPVYATLAEFGADTDL